MSWESQMIIPFRVLINDVEAPYKFEDDMVKKMLVTSAAQVLQDVRIIGSYTLDYETPSISPDPSPDPVFTNFVVMKAACLKNQYDFSAQAVSAGVRAKCGPVTMEKDSSSASVLTALLSDGFCAAYKEMKRQYNFGNVRGIKAVLTPFSHDDYSYLGSNITRSTYDNII